MYCIVWYHIHLTVANHQHKSLIACNRLFSFMHHSMFTYICLTVCCSLAQIMYNDMMRVGCCTVHTYHKRPSINRNGAIKLDHPVHNVDVSNTICIGFNSAQITNLPTMEEPTHNKITRQMHSIVGASLSQTRGVADIG